MAYCLLRQLESPRLISLFPRWRWCLQASAWSRPELRPHCLTTCHWSEVRFPSLYFPLIQVSSLYQVHSPIDTFHSFSLIQVPPSIHVSAFILILSADPIFPFIAVLSAKQVLFSPKFLSIQVLFLYPSFCLHLDTFHRSQLFVVGHCRRFVVELDVVSS